MNKVCLCGNENENCLEKSIFGLVLFASKVNNNAPQPKLFVNFNTFSHTFITFKNISTNN